MLYLVYTVLLFNVLIILFKYFHKKNISTLQVLIVNYFFSSCFSFFFLYMQLKDKHIFLDSSQMLSKFELSWIHYSIIIGILFVISFYLYSIGVQKIGISISTISSKMSVIIPVSIALIIYPQETLTYKKFFALSLSLAAIYFSSVRKEKIDLKNFLILILLIFISQGLTDSVFNDFVQKFKDANRYAFFAILFLSASFSGYLIHSLFFKEKGINKTSLVYGFVFSIPNFFSLLFFIKALTVMESSIAYPLASMGIIITSMLIAITFFKEKIDKLNWIGAIIALLAIYLFI